MRWVAILFVLAAIVAIGWFVGRLSPAQQFLQVPVPTSELGEPSEPVSAENADVLPEEANAEPGSDTAPTENLSTESPALEASDDAEPERETSEEAPLDQGEQDTPDPEPVPTWPVLQGSAALDQYRVWISEARALHPYSDSEQRMYDVMMCESGGNPSIVNPAGPYTGLFQYVAGTWNGEWNTYRESEITDARAQIFATALAWSLNMQSHWGCYTHPR